MLVDLEDCLSPLVSDSFKELGYGCSGCIYVSIYVVPSIYVYYTGRDGVNHDTWKLDRPVHFQSVLGMP